MQRQQAQGRTRAGLFLVASLFLALFAAVLVFKIVKKSQAELAEAKKPGQMVEIVIAQRDLYMGLPIGTDDVVVRQMAPGMVPEDETFITVDDVVGRTPRSLILANEPIREERLARPDAGIGLNAIVEPGKRAMTVATNTEDAVAGLLQPGNYVDIIVTIRPEEGAVVTKWATDTILQGIKVLAVGGQLSMQGSAEPVEKKSATNQPEEKKEKKKGTSQQDMMKRMKPSITLEVTPDEAEKLALAVAQGDIHVVLRSDIDILHYADNGPITSRTLIGLAPATVAAAATVVRNPQTPEVLPSGPTAVVIQGSSRTDVKFNEDGSNTQTSEKRKRGK